MDVFQTQVRWPFGFFSQIRIRLLFDGSVQDQSAGDVDGLAGHIVGKGERQIQEHVGNVLRRLGTLQGIARSVPSSVRIAASLGDIIQQPIPDVGMDDTGADTVDIDIVGRRIFGNGLGPTRDSKFRGGIRHIGGGIPLCRTWRTC